MNDDDELIEQLAALFGETGAAHHKAYIQTDGFDPDWPLWYAEYLSGRLPGLIGAQLTRSELVYQLVRLDKEQRRDAPAADWRRYYAEFFAGQSQTAG